MKSVRIWLLLSIPMITLPLGAIDVDPSKKTVPEKFYNSSGNRFSIFAGDPERIQKANAIDFSDFENKIEITPTPLAISSPAGVFKVNFGFRNKGKKTYTLSFPNTQRYELIIKNAVGQAVYTWSSDKIFLQQVGTSLINTTDQIAFVPSINLSDFDVTPTPGKYTVEATVANYPELKATAELVLTP